jgi:hypothetical protein
MHNVKIIRMQTGEDIMASMIGEEQEETVLLEDPMRLIFRRMPTGQTVMMMMPWLPIEIIKENNAIVYSTDILTIIEPKDDLVRYYGSVVSEAQLRMEEKRNFDEEYDDEEDEEDIDAEELFEILNEKKKHNIH